MHLPTLGFAGRPVARRRAGQGRALGFPSGRTRKMNGSGQIFILGMGSG